MRKRYFREVLSVLSVLSVGNREKMKTYRHTTGRPSKKMQAAPMTPTDRCRAYVERMEGAVSGQDGHARTLAAARVIFWGFDLSPSEGWPILLDYNQKCSPPWTTKELEHKMKEAMKPDAKFRRGHLLGDSCGHRGGTKKPSPWRAPYDAAKAERERTATKAKTALQKITQDYAWAPEDVWNDSPAILDDETSVNPAMLLTLFPRDAVVWTGEVNDSGHSKNWRNFRAVEIWLKMARKGLTVGPMIAPGTFQHGTTRRAKAGLVATPFTVLDFDTLPDGSKPDTEEGRAALMTLALSVTRWLREKMGAGLAAILKTGGKGVQVWFKTGSLDVEGLRDISESWGLDKGLIGHGEHPARLPGAVHQKTGRTATLLWCAVNS
jgi:hypothetical protein